jgi:hypothetical protein
MRWVYSLITRKPRVLLYFKGIIITNATGREDQHTPVAPNTGMPMLLTQKWPFGRRHHHQLTLEVIAISLWQ